MDNMQKIKEKIKKYLPEPETRICEFIFLSADKIWNSKIKEGSFWVIAEDRWDSDYGMFLIVMENGSVYITDLNCILDYCAASFPQFMEIMKLIQITLDTLSSPDIYNNENFEKKCEKAEQVLRQQVMKIDSTAIIDADGFYSTIIEEMGSGMF